MAAAPESSKHPNVYPWQRPIVERYGDMLNDTGGNDPLDLLEDLQRPSNTNFAITNEVRFVLAACVASQVSLIHMLERDGLLRDRTS